MKFEGVIFILMSLCSFSYANEYAVISNKLIKDLTPSQIKAVFLKKLTHLGGVHLVPVNLPSNEPIRKSFEENVLNMSNKRLKSYWMKQHYLGRRPPVVMKSPKSAIVFIQNVQGGITYVDTKDLDKSVKVLYIFRDEKEGR